VGGDFDGLEPDEVGTASVVALSLNSAGELSDCVLTGELPCQVAIGERRVPTPVRFTFDLRPNPERPQHSPHNLRLVTVVDGQTYEVTDDWLRMERYGCTRCWSLLGWCAA